MVGYVVVIEADGDRQIRELDLLDAIDHRFLSICCESEAFHDSHSWHYASDDLLRGQSASRSVSLLSPEQRAIAHILGTLDDKIELNRRMNETLEAMARALFKSWFVDFDPVRAKAEGRDPGLPKPLADLFPDSFEDSELGEIPKGWETIPSLRNGHVHQWGRVQERGFLCNRRRGCQWSK